MFVTFCVLKRKTETIGGQWSPSHATGFEGGDDPGDELVGSDYLGEENDSLIRATALTL